MRNIYAVYFVDSNIINSSSGAFNSNYASAFEFLNLRNATIIINVANTSIEGIFPCTAKGNSYLSVVLDFAFAEIPYIPFIGNSLVFINCCKSGSTGNLIGAIIYSPNFDITRAKRLSSTYASLIIYIELCSYSIASIYRHFIQHVAISVNSMEFRSLYVSWLSRKSSERHHGNNESCHGDDR